MKPVSAKCRLHRGKLVFAEQARTETRLNTTPVVLAIISQQKGRRVPCVLARVWSGGASVGGVADLLKKN